MCVLLIFGTAVFRGNVNTLTIQPIEAGTMPVIQGNSLVAVYYNQSWQAERRVLGALGGEDDIYRVLGGIGLKYPEIIEVLKCESNFKCIVTSVR